MAFEPETIFTPEALNFAALLERIFGQRRKQLLDARKIRQQQFDAGVLPNFLPQTAYIRNSDWKIAPVPQDLECRKVEITGPASRMDMVVNALNSGADCYMADVEDSESPTWQNIVRGQLNLYNVIRAKAGEVLHKKPDKEYKLNEKTAVLLFRPRGWHLEEKHCLVDGQPMSALLFDLGMYAYRNAQVLLQKGTGVYLYLPKMESRFEARLANDVCSFIEDRLWLPRGTIKVTVLIETLPAAFEMHEILWELNRGRHAAGLNCGRWDYIFSYIKTFGSHRDRLLPDRSALTMNQAFLKAYVNLLVQICHRRGAHAMGGMAAQIPSKNPEKNRIAEAKLRADKAREVMAGHDGTWVAHPASVPIAREIFNLDFLAGKSNQLEALRDDVKVTTEDLLNPVTGEVTVDGLRANISVAIQYLAAWLSGTGCVPINDLMEDAATAEISRMQVWQWIKHRAWISDFHNYVTLEFVFMLIGEELDKIKTAVGYARYSSGQYQRAANIFFTMVKRPEPPEFFTLIAYDLLE